MGSQRRWAGARRASSAVWRAALALSRVLARVGCGQCRWRCVVLPVGRGWEVGWREVQRGQIRVVGVMRGFAVGGRVAVGWRLW